MKPSLRGCEAPVKGCWLGPIIVQGLLSRWQPRLQKLDWPPVSTSRTPGQAVNLVDPTKEFLGDVYDVRIGMGQVNGPGAKVYRVAGYQLAQAEHYKQTLMAFGGAFKPTFHGPGLLADMQASIDLETKRLKAEEKAA